LFFSNKAILRLYGNIQRHNLLRTGGSEHLHAVIEHTTDGRTDPSYTCFVLCPKTSCSSPFSLPNQLDWYCLPRHVGTVRYSTQEQGPNDKLLQQDAPPSPFLPRNERLSRSPVSMEIDWQGHKGRPITWPPHSPHVTILEFLFLGGGDIITMLYTYLHGSLLCLNLPNG